MPESRIRSLSDDLCSLLDENVPNLPSTKSEKVIALSRQWVTLSTLPLRIPVMSMSDLVRVILHLSAPLHRDLMAMNFLT